MCRATQSLPRAGGLYDQDCYLVEAMNLVYAIQGAKDEAAMNKLVDQVKHAQR
jgi:hypothetical protein